MRRTPLALTLAAALAASLLTAQSAAATPLGGPLDPVLDPVLDAAADCGDLDPRACLLPFPDDRHTVLDPTTATGHRVDLDPLAMPRNLVGKPIDPEEWNRNDGFSPGTPILTVVPGIDLQRTFDLDPRPEDVPGADPWAPRDRLADDLLEDPARSMARHARIVLLDADTGERHPYWAELDENPGTLEDEADQTLIIRPLTNLAEGHRYIVALRDVRGRDSRPLAARAGFAELRAAWDRDVPRTFPAPSDPDPADEAARYDDIFDRLALRGVDPRGLYLAWDFHVASADNLAGRMLAMRDDAFTRLGDPVLDDGRVDGDAPAFEVTGTTEEVLEDRTERIVEGIVTVPNYLTLPDPLPQSRLFYGTPLPGVDATPVVNPLHPTFDAAFTCRFRTDVDQVVPMLYGHGLLGSRTEAQGGSTEDLRRSGYAACAVDWTGMSTHDVPNVALILQDVSLFPSLADRSQQGFLNFLFLGRALLHPDGLRTDPAFAVDDRPLLAEELVYDGNSQGGILGGALTAIAPDFTFSVLGVPGMNYSTLLNRSVDWEGKPGEPAYAAVMYEAYPDKVDQQLVFALMQMLWDRGEANGYAHHLTDDPYPDTPAHQVLFETAFGDYQVANVAAEVMARTAGADFLGTALARGRHWERSYAVGLDAVPFGFTGFRRDGGATVAPSGSALVYWDSGNPTPPNGNLPPAALGQDPHSDPRRDDVALLMKLRFLRDGVIADVRAGRPNWTEACPRHPDRLAC